MVEGIWIIVSRFNFLLFSTSLAIFIMNKKVEVLVFVFKILELNLQYNLPELCWVIECNFDQPKGSTDNLKTSDSLQMADVSTYGLCL